MPKIPIIKTKFPSQKWMMVERRTPQGRESVYPPITARRPDWYGREMSITGRPFPGADYMNEEYWLPMQGPELPADIEEYRRLFDRGNPWVPNRVDMSAEEQRIARERYLDAIRAALSRQAYNRKVAAWNSYRELPPRERAFIANQNKLRDVLYDYMPGYEANEYTRNYYNYEAMPPVKMVPGDKRTLDLDELKGFESFDEFPDNGWVDMPWNRWK